MSIYTYDQHLKTHACVAAEQCSFVLKKIKEALLLTGRKVMDESNINGKGMSIYAVSYTHLTLPTIA